MMRRAIRHAAPIQALTSVLAGRILASIAVTLLIAACGREQPVPLANYQFNAPVSAVTAQLAALAATGSTLSRIEARRPPLRADSRITGDKGLVTITVPGGTDQRNVVLTFSITQLYDSHKSMVALTIDAPDANEIDLGPERFASPKTLGKEFGDALGGLAAKVNGTYHRGDPSRQFARLFDLAAVLDDPALRTRVIRRGKQEGSVDFLFSDQPRGHRFND